MKRMHKVSQMTKRLIFTLANLCANTPLTLTLHFLLLYLLSLPVLVFHYEFWVLVKHRILAFGQWGKGREHIPGMNIRRCAFHDVVGLLYHGSHIQVITMVEEILRSDK